MFWKSKINLDEDKKENFRMEIVQKDLVFAAIQCAVFKVSQQTVSDMRS